MKSFTDDSATYAAPVLLQIAGMARRSKRDFAGYLLEMAAAVLEQDLPGAEFSRAYCKVLSMRL